MFCSWCSGYRLECNRQPRGSLKSSLARRERELRKEAPKYLSSFTHKDNCRRVLHFYIHAPLYMHSPPFYMFDESTPGNNHACLDHSTARPPARNPSCQSKVQIIPFTGSHLLPPTPLLLDELAIRGVEMLRIRNDRNALPLESALDVLPSCENRTGAILSVDKPPFALIGTASTAPDWLSQIVSTVSVHELLAQHDERSSCLLPESSPGQDAVRLFTSGSTGQPKIIAWSHEVLATYCQGIKDRLSLGPETRHFQTASYEFDGNRHRVNGGWLSLSPTRRGGNQL